MTATSPGSRGHLPSFRFCRASCHRWVPFCIPKSPRREQKEKKKDHYKADVLKVPTDSQKVSGFHILTLYRLGHSFSLYFAIKAFSSLVPTKSQKDRPTIPFSNLRCRALISVKLLVKLMLNKRSRQEFGQILLITWQCYIHIRIRTSSAVSHP